MISLMMEFKNVVEKMQSPTFLFLTIIPMITANMHALLIEMSLAKNVISLKKLVRLSFMFIVNAL